MKTHTCITFIDHWWRVMWKNLLLWCQRLICFADVSHESCHGMGVCASIWCGVYSEVSYFWASSLDWLYCRGILKNLFVFLSDTRMCTNNSWHYGKQSIKCKKQFECLPFVHYDLRKQLHFVLRSEALLRKTCCIGVSLFASVSERVPVVRYWVCVSYFRMNQCHFTSWFF